MGGLRMSSYPSRDSHFAHRVVRLMLKTCAAQEIGAIAVNLVAFVAHTEDATHYTRAVTFYNDQLLPLLGIRKWDTLDGARTAAVESGWLHYETAGIGNRKPGIYWTLIPGRLEELDDAPTDEGLTPHDWFRNG